MTENYYIKIDTLSGVVGWSHRS